MKQVTLLRIASASILKNKMRTLLTMLGIVIGVGAVIVMVAIGNGAQTQIASQINALGTNLIIVMPGVGNARRREPGRWARSTSSRVADADKLKQEGTLFAGRVASRASPTTARRSSPVGINWRTKHQRRVPRLHRRYAIGRRAPGEVLHRRRRQSGAQGRSPRRHGGAGPLSEFRSGRRANPAGQGAVHGGRRHGQPRVKMPPGNDQDDVVIDAGYTTAQMQRLSGNVRIGQILVTTASRPTKWMRRRTKCRRSCEKHIDWMERTTISPCAIRPSWLPR